MPAAYAHLAFGRMVRRTLPDGDVKRAVALYPDLFDIGLQGPDILFFYHPLKSNPVSRFGHGLHDKTCLSFLERPVCREADAAGTAYLLGLICHFALDSECHTLVEYFMTVTGREHSDVETDLERALMAGDGLDPNRHAAASYVADTRENAAVIAPFYALDGGTVKTALTSMKVVGSLLTPVCRAKRALLVFVTERMGKRCLPRQFVMDWDPDPVYAVSNRVLREKLEQSAPVAFGLMENFLDWKEGRGPLCEGFAKTFSYDEEELARLKAQKAYQ